MNYDFVLALDPSGSFHEGKGTTGWCVMECAARRVTRGGDIRAITHPSMEAYWAKHLKLIEDNHTRYKKRLVVVIEDYLLYAHKSESQINSRMETCKLIGVLQHYCWSQQIPYVMQIPAEVKNRWTNEILHHKRFIAVCNQHLVIPGTKIQLDRHALDAVRHAAHFVTFKNGARGEKKNEVYHHESPAERGLAATL